MVNQPDDPKRGESPDNPMEVYQPSVIPPSPETLARHAGDFRLASVAGPPVTLPRAYRLPATDPDADQRDLGTCMVWSGYRVLRSEYRRLFAAVPDFAELWGYIDYNEAEGTPCQDQGAEPHILFERLAKVGVIPEALRPYGVRPWCSPTTPAERVEAAKVRAGAYIRARDLTEVKATIYGTSTGREVSCCFILRDNFASYEVLNGQSFFPRPSQKVWGGHAMTWDGWDDDLLCPDGTRGALHQCNQWGRGLNDLWLPYSLYNLPDWTSNNGPGPWKDSMLSVVSINGQTDPTPQPQPDPGPTPDPTPDPPPPDTKADRMRAAAHHAVDPYIEAARQKPNSYLARYALPAAEMVRDAVELEYEQ